MGAQGVVRGVWGRVGDNRVALGMMYSADMGGLWG